jgi:aspartate-semialdehyde dehydrogenase
MKIAVVGVTGLVGKVMIKVLEERNFPFTNLLPVASEKSIGQKVRINGEEYPVIGLEDAIKERPDLALFSAGAAVSREWAPRFAEVGTRVVDNSSAWRMEPNIKLIVPEVNAMQLEREDMIIANPNCSTIQMVVALAPLHRQYQIERLVVSTYQAVTGTGVKAVKQYELEKEGFSPEADDRAYPYPIFGNCLPHCDVFLENDYTKEEMKLVHETKKILSDQQIKITATAVRVPVKGGHSESVNIAFEKAFQVEDIKKLMIESPGIILQDDVALNIYPMPRTANGRDEVFVGRIRRDESIENGLNMWIVADNLRKGAATNAIQIGEYLISQGWLG